MLTSSTFTLKAVSTASFTCNLIGALVDLEAELLELLRLGVGLLGDNRAPDDIVYVHFSIPFP